MLRLVSLASARFLALSALTAAVAALGCSGAAGVDGATDSHQIALACTSSPEWRDSQTYTAGSFVEYEGNAYKVLMTHKSLVSSEPDHSPSLFALVGDCSAADACGEVSGAPHASISWTYGDADDWGDLSGTYKTCNMGSRQTPIDIKAAETMPTTAPLAFWSYDSAIPLHLENNGHTLQVNYSGKKGMSDPHVTYKGKDFYLLQLHFHTPSEHTFDGKQGALEVHFVHEAADGQKAVVGVLIDDDLANAEFAKILKDRPQAGKAVNVCKTSLSLQAFLPADHTSYHYQGSLTTPPCSEGLQWWVMKEHVHVGGDQRKGFASLFPEETSRPVQPVGGRLVELYTDTAAH